MDRAEAAQQTAMIQTSEIVVHEKAFRSGRGIQPADLRRVILPGLILDAVAGMSFFSALTHPFLKAQAVFLRHLHIRMAHQRRDIDAEPDPLLLQALSHPTVDPGHSSVLFQRPGRHQQQVAFLHQEDAVDLRPPAEADQLFQLFLPPILKDHFSKPVLHIASSIRPY